MRRLLRSFGLFFSVLLMAACGGGGSSDGGTAAGGGGGSGGGAAVITYTGVQSQATVNASNASRIFSVVWNGGSATGMTGSTRKTAAAAPSQAVTAQAMLWRGVARQIKLAADSSVAAKSATAPVSIHETLNGAVTGSVTIAGSLDGTTGTGTLTMTFSNFSDGDGYTFDGAATMRVTRYDMALDTVIDADITFSLLTVTAQSGALSLSGSFRLQENPQVHRETLTIDANGRDRSTSETFRYENFVITSDSPGLSTARSEAYAGRVYLETLGYVEVSTTAACGYGAADINPTSGGPVVLSGASNTTARATPCANGYVSIDVDADGDGSYENGNWYAWEDLSAPVEMVASMYIMQTLPRVSPGTVYQMHVWGSLLDGTSQDVTERVSWKSSDPSVATVSETGVLTGMALGTTIVTAKLGTLTAVLQVDVLPVVLSLIEVAPQYPALINGSSLQFTATGTFSYGSRQDLTASVSWESSNPTVATVSNVPGSYGLVQAVGAGSATITARGYVTSGYTFVTVQN